MRLCVLLVSLSLLAPAAWAQNGKADKPQGGIRTKNVNPDQAHYERGVRKLEGPLLLKYLRDQLSLTREQKPKWDQLVTYYKMKRTEMGQNISDQTDELRRLQEDLMKARAAGDKDKMRQIKDQIDALVPTTRLMDETLQMAQSFLTHGQNRRLAKLLEAIKQGTPIDLRLKPREAVVAAEGLGLTPEQRTSLVKLEDGFRVRVASLRINDEEGRTQAMEDFIEDIKKILAPAQLEGFEQHIMGRAKALQQQDESGAEPAAESGKSPESKNETAQPGDETSAPEPETTPKKP